MTHPYGHGRRGQGRHHSGGNGQHNQNHPESSPTGDSGRDPRASGPAQAGANAAQQGAGASPGAQRKGPGHKIPGHVLAAYLSDARLNILACINDVLVKSGRKPFKDEAESLAALDALGLTTALPEEQRRRMNLVRERFPFLNPMTDPRPGEPDKLLTKPQSLLRNQDSAKREKKAAERAEQVYDLKPAAFEYRLRRLFGLVNDLRNALVHAAAPPATLSPDDYRYLAQDLGKVYDGSRRTVATRFGLDPKTMDPLLRLDGKGGRGSEPKPKAKPRPYSQFSLAIGVDSETFPAGEAALPVPVLDALHDFGIVLLCALFLDKAQSAELIGYFWQAGYARHWTAEQQAIVKELVAVYRVRLPLQRLRSDNSAAAIALDTLSEVSRCPEVLFQALSQEDQRRFRTGATPGTTRDAVTSDTDDPEGACLMVRRRDRFIPLMMRLFDLDPECRLRFAIDLGQYFFNVRLKPGSAYTDKRVRVRRLGQKMVSYGRLQDFLDAPKLPTWQRLEANCEDSADAAERARGEAMAGIQPLPPYIVPTQPHYHFDEDKIGIRLSAADAVATYPELPAEVAEANTDRCVIRGREMEPDFWISPAQMLHLAFFTHLQKRDRRCLTPDTILKAYRGSVQRLLRQLAEGLPDLAGAPRTDARRSAAQDWINAIFRVGEQPDSPEVYLGELPELVSRALLDADQVSACALSQTTLDERFGHLIDDTTARIKRLDAMLLGLKKRGKAGFQPIKAGPVAVFLAEDLLRFQPLDPDPQAQCGGKINSQQYQILEAALAYYALHLEEPPRIVELLRDAKLLDGPTRHPFLHRLGLAVEPDRYPGIMSFFRAYLRERLAFLEGEHRRLARRDHQEPPPRWLRLRQQSSLQSWLDALRDEHGGLGDTLKALPVPANLFYRPVLGAVARALDTTPQALLELGSRRTERNGQIAAIRPALTWLLQRYLDHQGDGPQAMYQYPRSHDLFDLYLDTRTKAYQAKTHRPMTAEARAEALPRILQGDPIPRLKELDRKTAEDKRAKVYAAYRRREREVRHLSTQDMALFLHGRHYFEHHVRLPAGAARPVWRLSDIEHTLMNTAIDVELPVPGTNRSLRHPSCKVRNLGELGLLVRDRRLPSLLPYYPPAEAMIDQAEIRAELASYRRERVAAMDLIERIERAIVNATDTPPPEALEKADQATFGTGEHGKLLYQLRQLWEQRCDAPGQAETAAAFSDDRFRQALALRNALAHNGYPAVERFPDLAAAVALEPLPANPANHRQIAARLRSALHSIYEPWHAFLTATTQGHRHV